jgi:hypothetical protein
VLLQSIIESSLLRPISSWLRELSIQSFPCQTELHGFLDEFFIQERPNCTGFQLLVSGEDEAKTLVAVDLLVSGHDGLGDSIPKDIPVSSGNGLGNTALWLGEFLNSQTKEWGGKLW